MYNLRNLHQRQKFKEYVNEQMKESLITGVPAIVSSKSNSRRSVKSIMFLLCTAGFFYQTYTFVESFLKFETIQNLRIEYPIEFMAPAVTFCNKNRINRELFCKSFPGECLWYETRDKFCTAAPLLCDTSKGDTLMVFAVPRNISQKTPNLTNEFLDAYGPQSSWEYLSKEVRSSCQSQIKGLLEYCKDEDSILIQVPSGGLPYKCFSVYSLLEKPDKEPRNISIIDGYSFIIYTYPERLMYEKDNVQFYMYVHDPRRLANPIAEGILLNGGYKYTFSFTMQQIQNLPPPYTTYCTDYVNKWKENEGQGPFTKKDCIEICKIERMMEKHMCVGKSISYPHRFPICSQNIDISDTVVQDCSSSCMEACDATLYVIARKHEEDETYSSKVGNRRLLKVDLKFGDVSVERIFMEPKFQNIELFSYIGGFMGLWLGISFITFVDFLETVTDVITFAVMKWEKTRKKKSIHHMFRH